MGTHKIYSGIQGIRDNISGSLYGDCHELLARNGGKLAGYFTSVAEDLNSGLQSTNPTRGQSGA